MRVANVTPATHRPMDMMQIATTQTNTCDSASIGEFFAKWELRTPSKKLNIEISQIDGATVVRLSGQLDESTAAQLQSECSRWMDRGCPAMLLDLSEVSVATSEGVRIVLIA